MKIFPLDIIAGILLVFGIIQLIYGYIIRRNTVKSRIIIIFIMGSLLMAISIAYFCFTLNGLEHQAELMAFLWIGWAVAGFLIIFIRRCMSR